MNILFTCGGTAGHINPAVALARTFQANHPQCNIIFVGADGGMETNLVPKEGYDLRTVTISNFHRSFAPADIIHNFKTLMNLQKSKSQAKKIIADFQPNLVVGTGGYASFPVVKESARQGIPSAVHEANAMPGLTTKALSKVVDCVMVGFAESARHYENPEKVVVTGTPVRPEFFQYTREEARAKLGITHDKPILLSFFGSLGATVMNGYVTEFFQKEQEQNFPFHHIHGAGRNYETMKGQAPSHPMIDLREYIYDMPLVMAAADVIICRGGASTIAEVAALAKPAIFIPSPNVTADHQTKNAAQLADGGGAVLLPEKECSVDRLWRETSDLLSDSQKRISMRNALQAMSTNNPTQVIYETLMALLAKN